MDGTQVKLVLDYIKKNKDGISSMEAFKFGITRLSAVIYILRHDRGIEIDAIPQRCINRYGHPTRYVRYVYRGGGK